MKFSLPQFSRLVALLFFGILLTFAIPLLARDIQLPASRFVEVRQIRGTVTYQGRPARVGDRLTRSGQQISTGRQSSAVLAVDSGIARINVAELTTVQVQGLSIANGGRITRLSVPRGQARIQARPLTNPNSRLEISSPAGVTGVRGTEFGVGVGPGGKTGVSTLEGAVATTAKGRTVTVNGGYSSLVFPGDPPTPPKLTQENLKYELISLSAIDRNRVRLICTVDPLNLVFLNDQPLEMDKTGKIDTVLPMPANSDYRLVIRTPLGNQESHEIGSALLK
ncbi:MAG TPA: iron dicitrate transport regulator FecR [Cyanobacteria bacterium UBA11369]|nr:iron dicitrate transport regulator FecR [Cyanobacteria bacterium UBA11371]HBE35667.1 iron dicitrate transport regulator FecR [Cyanobacteria bacterium UBA11368]HBE47799.1 iron dicitrate transport regulator FecR [Cyanobacteria bacterium UBA11369]